MGLFDKLRTPKWQHKDPDVRIKAIKKLDDQEILAEVAKNDSNGEVRKEAVIKISDESVLADVAKNDSEWLVRFQAVKKIKDESVLADVAKNDPVINVRCEAALRCNDQSILTTMAKDSKIPESFRIKAIQKINSGQVLREIICANRPTTKKVIVGYYWKNDMSKVVGYSDRDGYEYEQIKVPKYETKEIISPIYTEANRRFRKITIKDPNPGTESFKYKGEYLFGVAPNSNETSNEWYICDDCGKRVNKNAIDIHGKCPHCGSINVRKK